MTSTKSISKITKNATKPIN